MKQNWFSRQGKGILTFLFFLISALYNDSNAYLLNTFNSYDKYRGLQYETIIDSTKSLSFDSLLKIKAGDFQKFTF